MLWYAHHISIKLLKWEWGVTLARFKVFLEKRQGQKF